MKKREGKTEEVKRRRARKGIEKTKGKETREVRRQKKVSKRGKRGKRRNDGPRIGE